MSMMSELSALISGCGVPVETGVFSDLPPDEYVVVTPLLDHFELYADNQPGFDVQEARISLFSKGNYLARKDAIVRALMAADFTITERRYVGREDDTGYHNFAVDVAKEYEEES